MNRRNFISRLSVALASSLLIPQLILGLEKEIPNPKYNALCTPDLELEHKGYLYSSFGTEPSSIVKFDLWLDTKDDKLKIFQNGEWRIISPERVMPLVFRKE